MRTVFESLCNENCLRVRVFESFYGEFYRVRESAPDGSSPRGYVLFVEPDVGYDAFLWQLL